MYNKQIKNISYNKIKILIWWWMPTHHQSAFFRACRDLGVDLVVHYFGPVIKKRIELGWENIKDLPLHEFFVKASLDSLENCSDWRQRIHIVPGYGTIFLRSLIKKLCKEKVSWIHWSEPSKIGLGWNKYIRWIASYPIKRWQACMINRHSLGAFATGELARRDFRKWGVKEQKIYFLPYAVEKPAACELDPEINAFTKQHNLVFMHLGTLEYRKGIDVLIKAFSNIAHYNLMVCLVLVGADYSRGAYVRQVKALNIQDQVYFRGPVPAKRISSVLRLSHVVVLASRFDGWGVVLNEAIALGRAVISTDMCSAAYHLIKEGSNGFVVSNGSVSELAQTMERYICDANLYKLHGLSSLSISDNFTPNRNVERLMRGVTEMVIRHRLK